MSESLKTENGKYSADIWHEYCKSRYIGVEEIQLPSGEILKKPLSSAELDKEQFNIYMTQVEVFAAENGIYLAD